MTNTGNIVQCPHGSECGACALLGVGYSDQLRRKGEVLAKAFGQHPELRTVKPLPCLPSPRVDGYRNRARMAIGISRDGSTHVGYFRAGTREIVDAPDCRVLVPQLLDTIRRIRRFLETTKNIPRTLRHIDVRCGTDAERQHLTLVFRATECPKFPLEALQRKCPAIKGFSYNLNPTAGPQVIRGAVQHIWGEREIWVKYEGLHLRVSPGAFFQVNLTVLPKIHELMHRFFERGDVLADLYAGVGTHGLALHKNFRRVFFAEGNRSAVADLKSTILEHGISGCRISSVAVERGLVRLREEQPDAVVLNPSRAGADPVVLDALARCPTKKLAYLSCDPDTLCRDLTILVERGFEVQSVQPIDMMPQTRQVEALALLVRKARVKDEEKTPRRSRPTRGKPRSPSK